MRFELSDLIINDCKSKYDNEEDVVACALTRAKGLYYVEDVPPDVSRGKIDTLAADTIDAMRAKLLK